MSEIDPSGSQRKLQYLGETKDGYEVRCGRYQESKGNAPNCQGVIMIYPLLFLDGPILSSCSLCKNVDEVYPENPLAEEQNVLWRAKKQKYESNGRHVDRLSIPDFGEVEFISIDKRDLEWKSDPARYY